MKGTAMKWILYLALFALYLLHNDLWLWNDARLVFGIPVGLVYHIGFSVAASLLMLLLVKFAWPSHLEAESNKETEA